MVVASYCLALTLLNRVNLLVGGMLRLVARLVVLDVCVRIAERIVAAHFLQQNKQSQTQPIF